ncbi:MAG: acetate--CoA ligase family protein, partial [Lysobacterales bacterium]|jgi:acyl-CoA synthetase (NDP forming)
VAKTEREPTRDLVTRLGALSEKFKKPVAVYVSANSEETNALRQGLDSPIFTRIVEMFRALKLDYEYARSAASVASEKTFPAYEVQQGAVQSLLATAAHERRDLLLNEALEVLERYGIPTVRGSAATTADEAVAVADSIGYPVAMKIIAEQISHKSDVGGVQLNLRSAGDVRATFEDMYARLGEAFPEASLDGVMVQPMASGGRELILGGRQDRQFGPVVLVGLGGIFVEIFEQASMRIAPITREDALDMIEELSGAPILMGARGHKRSDIDAIIEAILRVSQLLVDFPEIQELDINPLRVFHEGEGCLALDARIIR